MRWIKRAVLILLAMIIASAVLLALSWKWSELKRDRFYQARPLLSAMNSVHDGVWTNNAFRARELLLQRMPLGSAERSVIDVLEREGFGCQASSRKYEKGTNCQLLAPAGLGYMRWIIDLEFSDSKQLTDARIEIWNIFL